jgi:hypothetical protein
MGDADVVFAEQDLPTVRSFAHRTHCIYNVLLGSSLRHSNRRATSRENNDILANFRGTQSPAGRSPPTGTDLRLTCTCFFLPQIAQNKRSKQMTAKKPTHKAFRPRARKEVSETKKMQMHYKRNMQIIMKCRKLMASMLNPRPSKESKAAPGPQALPKDATAAGAGRRSSPRERVANRKYESDEYECNTSGVKVGSKTGTAGKTEKSTRLSASDSNAAQRSPLSVESKALLATKRKRGADENEAANISPRAGTDPSLASLSSIEEPAAPAAKRAKRIKARRIEATQAETAAAGGCTRTPGCTKAPRHTGFCTGHKVNSRENRANRAHTSRASHSSHTSHTARNAQTAQRTFDGTKNVRA